MRQKFSKQVAGVHMSKSLSFGPALGSVPKLDYFDGTGVPKRGGRSPRWHWAVSQSWKTKLMHRDI